MTKTKKNFLVALFFIMTSLGAFVTSLHAQDTRQKTLGAGIFFPVGLVQGTNVYSRDHRSPWSGWGFNGYVDIIKNFYLGLDISQLQSRVTHDNIINAEKTIMKEIRGQIGYSTSWHPTSVWRAYLSVGSTNGTNQGSFEGYSYGLGLKWAKYFSNRLMLFVGSDWHQHHFDIKSTPFWQPRFNQASIVRFYVGGGIYLDQ